MATEKNSICYHCGNALDENQNKFLPIEIKDSYNVAIKVRDVENAICVLALRRVLEKVCNDKNAQGSNLYDKLKDLQKSNSIPPMMDQLCYMLTLNDDIEVDETTVQLLVEFTQLILDYVYTLPNKLKLTQQYLEQKMKKQQEAEYLKLRNKSLEEQLERKKEEIEKLKVIEQAYEAFKKSL